MLAHLFLLLVDNDRVRSEALDRWLLGLLLLLLVLLLVLLLLATTALALASIRGSALVATAG